MRQGRRYEPCIFANPNLTDVANTNPIFVNPNLPDVDFVKDEAGMLTRVNSIDGLIIVYLRDTFIADISTAIRQPI